MHRSVSRGGRALQALPSSPRPASNQEFSRLIHALEPLLLFAPSPARVSNSLIGGIDTEYLFPGDPPPPRLPPNPRPQSPFASKLANASLVPVAVPSPQDEQ